MTNYNNEILRYYEGLRQDSREELRARVAEIYKSYPAISDIDKEISSTGLLMTRAAIGGDTTEVEELRVRMEILIDNRIGLLERLGVDESMFLPRYKCEKCKDTGYLEGGRKCSCLESIENMHLYRMSNIEKRLKTDNFSCFKLNRFSDEVSDEHNISPRENMKNIMRLSRDFIEGITSGDSIPKIGNLLFYGATGTGKTFLCSCIADILLNRGFSVIYQTATQISEICRDYRFASAGSERLADEKYQRLLDCDCLIIDDLGSELINSLTISELFNIINERMISQRPVIISTNLRPTDILELYNERIYSRIAGNYMLLEFFGDDLRYS